MCDWSLRLGLCGPLRISSHDPHGMTSRATFVMADETGRSRAFFGRRKGHPLRPQQAALFETLLPRLALDLTAPPPAPASLFPEPVDDVRLEIGFGGGEHLIAEARTHPRTGFIGVEPFVNGMAKALAAIARGTSREHPAPSRRCDGARGLAAPGLARARRSHLSRPLAETPALETPFRAGPKRRRDRPYPAAGRRIPVRERHPGLCGLDAQPSDPIARLCMDGGARRRLAPSVAGLFRDALRGQGQARRPRTLLSDFPQDGRPAADADA